MTYPSPSKNSRPSAHACVALLICGVMAAPVSSHAQTTGGSFGGSSWGAGRSGGRSGGTSAIGSRSSGRGGGGGSVEIDGELVDALVELAGVLLEAYAEGKCNHVREQAFRSVPQARMLAHHACASYSTDLQSFRSQMDFIVQHRRDVIALRPLRPQLLSWDLEALTRGRTIALQRRDRSARFQSRLTEILRATTRTQGDLVAGDCVPRSDLESIRLSISRALGCQGTYDRIARRMLAMRAQTVEYMRLLTRAQSDAAGLRAGDPWGEDCWNNRNRSQRWTDESLRDCLQQR